MKGSMFTGYFNKSKYTNVKIVQRYYQTRRITNKTLRRIDKRRKEQVIRELFALRMSEHAARYRKQLYKRLKYEKEINLKKNKSMTLFKLALSNINEHIYTHWTEANRLKQKTYCCLTMIL